MRNSALPALLGGDPAFRKILPIVRPSLPPHGPLLADIRKVLESNQLTNGKYVREFEKRAAERLSVPECVAVSSCTAGLALVMRALELKGEVIVPSFTFFASAHALAWNGLKPVFCDCEEESFNIAPNRVEELIRPQTSAILAVHIFGNPADADRLEQIAQKNGLKLIFDAAHAFGSRREGRPVGGFGDAEIFSLSPTKLLVAGEGGLVATRNSQLAARMRAARNYGDPGTYDPTIVGLNARMAEINALLALHGLDSVDTRVRRRNAIATRIEAALRDVPGLSFQKVRAVDVSTYKDFSVIVEAERFGLTRDELAQALTAEKIDVRKYFYPPLHELTLYRPMRPSGANNLTVTEKISHNVVSLPIYSSLRSEEVEKIVCAIYRIHEHRSRVGEALRCPTRQGSGGAAIGVGAR